MQVVGKIEEIHEIVKRTETFSVREFVLEITSQNSQYSEHVLFQLTNTRTNIIDQYQVGQEVVVDFDLQGRKWTNPEGRVVFFNRLNAWRISPYNPQATGGYQQPMGGFQQQPIGGFQQQPAGGFQQQPMGGFQQQPAGGFQQQPMGGFQQPAPQPAPAPQTPAAGGGDDDLPF